MPPSRRSLVLAAGVLVGLLALGVAGTVVVVEPFAPDEHETALEDAASNQDRIEHVQGTVVSERTTGEEHSVTREEIQQRPTGENGGGQAPYVGGNDAIGSTIAEEATDGNVAIEYVGVETVADRQAHVYDLTPLAAANRSVSILVGETEYVIPLERGEGDDEYTFDSVRLWVDAEHHYPVKQRTITHIDGETIQTTTRFSDIEYETDDDDDPAEETNSGTTPDDGPEPDRERYERLDRVPSVVPFEVPDPSVPDGYEFEQAIVVDDGAISLRMEYTTADDRSLWVIVDEEPPSPAEQPVAENVGAVDGDLYQQPRQWALYWECTDRHLQAVTEANRQLAVTVAESVGC